MSAFRARLLRTLVALAALGGLFAAGLLLSPERARARAAGRSLLPPGSTAEVEAIELLEGGAVRLALRRQGEGWTAQAPGAPAAADLPAGAAVFPADRGRVEGLLDTLASLRQGTLVSGDPARGAALGLEEGEARQVVLHRGGGRPDIGLLVGARAPGGDEDYLRVRGEPGAWQVRGNLSVLLAQDRAYWLDLRLLPADVRGADIGRVRVSGGDSAAGYTLSRGPDGSWLLAEAAGQEGPADPAAAEGMAGALARLEGEDLAPQTVPRSSADGTAPGALEVEVTTLAGRRHTLRVGGGSVPGKALVTAGGSPWAWVVNAAALQRAVRPAAALRAGR